MLLTLNMRYLSLFISINLIPFSVSLDDDTFLLANNDVLGTQNLDEWKLSPSNLDPGIGTGTGEGEFIAWNNNNDGALNLNHDTTVFNSNPNPNLLPADNTFLLPPATEGNPNKIDSLLTSCSSSTTDRLDARDDNGASCVPRLEFNLPSLPTLEQIEKAVDTPPDPGPKPDPSPANQITPFLRQDSKCPPPYPYQLCCICDDRMMYEVCQDCISCEF